MKLLFAVLLFLPSVLFAQKNADIKALDSLLTLLNKTNRFNGTVLYAEKGKIIYKKAVGVTDFRTNRGIIAPGYFADLVLIDPATVKDNSTIENPTALSDGIVKVWVNGVLVYKDKTALQKYPGEFVGR